MTVIASPSYNTSLSPDKEAAIEEHALLNDATQIYCDGSGYRGHIGAAAILFRAGQRPRILVFTVNIVLS